MTFPVQFIEEVVSRTDLGALIGRDVPLKKHGRELIGCCPFHREKTPSFTVAPEKGFYHCFGCGAHGDAVAYMQEGRGLSFIEAIEWLAQQAGLALPGRTAVEGRRLRSGVAPVVVKAAAPEEDARTRERLYQVWRAAKPLAGSPAAVYLGSRGIDAPTVARLQAVRFAVLPYYWTPPRDPRHPVPTKAQKLGDWPCMVAAVTDRDGRFKALHQTWLADDGCGKRLIVAPDGEPLKAKKVRGPAGGGAIRLIPLPEGATALAGAEGIETAASVAQALGDGVAVWALYSLGNLGGGGLGKGARHPQRAGVFLPSVAPDPDRPGFLPPAGVQTFTWFADGDGKDPLAADCLVRRGAVRYAQAGVTMAVAKAPAGLDFNDILQGASHD